MAAPTEPVFKEDPTLAAAWPSPFASAAGKFRAHASDCSNSDNRRTFEVHDSSSGAGAPTELVRCATPELLYSSEEPAMPASTAAAVGPFEKSIQRAKETTSPATAGGNSAARRSVGKATAVPAWERLSNDYTRKQERLAQLRWEKEQQEAKSCTFHPELINRSGKLVSPTRHSTTAGSNGGSSSSRCCSSAGTALVNSSSSSRSKGFASSAVTSSADASTDSDPARTGSSSSSSSSSSSTERSAGGWITRFSSNQRSAVGSSSSVAPATNTNTAGGSNNAKLSVSVECLSSRKTATATTVSAVLSRVQSIERYSGSSSSKTTAMGTAPIPISSGSSSSRKSASTAGGGSKPVVRRSSSIGSSTSGSSSRAPKKPTAVHSSSRSSGHNRSVSSTNSIIDQLPAAAAASDNGSCTTRTPCTLSTVATAISNLARRASHASKGSTDTHAPTSSSSSNTIQASGASSQLGSRPTHNRSCDLPRVLSASLQSFRSKSPTPLAPAAAAVVCSSPRALAAQSAQDTSLDDTPSIIASAAAAVAAVILAGCGGSNSGVELNSDADQQLLSCASESAQPLMEGSNLQQQQQQEADAQQQQQHMVLQLLPLEGSRLTDEDSMLPELMQYSEVWGQQQQQQSQQVLVTEQQQQQQQQSQQQQGCVPEQQEAPAVATTTTSTVAASMAPQQQHEQQQQPACHWQAAAAAAAAGHTPRLSEQESVPGSGLQPQASEVTQQIHENLLFGDLKCDMSDLRSHRISDAGIWAAEGSADLVTTCNISSNMQILTGSSTELTTIRRSKIMPEVDQITHTLDTSHVSRSQRTISLRSIGSVAAELSWESLLSKELSSAPAAAAVAAVGENSALSLCSDRSIRDSRPQVPADRFGGPHRQKKFGLVSLTKGAFKAGAVIGLSAYSYRYRVPLTAAAVEAAAAVRSACIAAGEYGSSMIAAVQQHAGPAAAAAVSRARSTAGVIRKRGVATADGARRGSSRAAEAVQAHARRVAAAAADHTKRATAAAKQRAGTLMRVLHRRAGRSSSTAAVQE